MGNVLSKVVLAKVVLVSLALGALSAPAVAQQARLGTSLSDTTPAGEPTTTVSASGFTPLATGSFTPAFGALALGVSSTGPTGGTAPLFGGDPLASQNFNASFATTVYGSELGFFAGYNGANSMFNMTPTPGYNMGATVGYAGFYLQAGVSDNTQQTLRLTNDPKQGWLAGFGYKRGAFNVRFSYMTAQGFSGAGPDTDTRTWMIGGIYQLSSRLRLNADAFTSPRATAVTTPAPATNAAPQGTGARVGLQLRF